MNLHAREDAFSHKVDMPSKLVELKIARMPCIAVFANMQTKNASPCSASTGVGIWLKIKFFFSQMKICLAFFLTTETNEIRGLMSI